MKALSTEVKPNFSDFYNPPTDKAVGFISTSGRCTCFGWCQDSYSTLVALSVVGSSTAINALWAHIVAGKSLTIYFGNDADRTSSFNSSYAHSAGHGYKAKRKIVITDEGSPTQWYSMIVTESTLWGLPKITVGENSGIDYAYLPHTADYRERMRFRIRQLVTIDVLPQWADYLWEAGEKSRMCGKLLDSGDDRYKNARSFNCAYMSTSQDDWEKIIQKGLKDGLIKI
jgi:hypothetical protein